MDSADRPSPSAIATAAATIRSTLGALGLALNAVVWWNSLYLDAAVKQLPAQGFPATEEMCARLSPIAYDHINFLGRYAFTRAEVGGALRPFHQADPGA
ncbi:Tn3 family transposase [Nonomuraea sp. SYSU D8015]|uniref:Tn3 family transposase n=1 Tax=Nonomuraea sp. SYSU D8015 TaxID=2593644 RepID=UPI00166008A8|nr:Tn3 family transposase [Nonomuraea sp. SYSU D8015]